MHQRVDNPNKIIQKEVWSTQFTWWSWDGSWLDSEFMSSFNSSYGMSALTLNFFYPTPMAHFFCWWHYLYTGSQTSMLSCSIKCPTEPISWTDLLVISFYSSMCSRFSPFSDRKTGLTVWTSQRNTFTELDSLRLTLETMPWITPVFLL